MATENPRKPAVLAFCRVHRAFYPVAQECPQCQHQPAPLTPVGRLLLGTAVASAAGYVLWQALLGPGHGPWGWW